MACILRCSIYFWELCKMFFFLNWSCYLCLVISFLGSIFHDNKFYVQIWFFFLSYLQDVSISGFFRIILFEHCNEVVEDNPYTTDTQNSTMKRYVYIDDDESSHDIYCDNRISNRKYTVLNFLPKNLWEQFR